MVSKVVALAVAVWLWSLPQQAACEITLVRTGPFEQAFEQSFLLHSDAVGRDFLVSVFAPPGASPPPSAKLPVIYALDQGYDIAGPAVRTLGGVIEAPFVVEVGYLPADFRYRMTDLLFDKVHVGGVDEGGGGAAFQKFLLQELRPWIEARFPVDPARSILMGHSAAAFFAADVLAGQAHRLPRLYPGEPVLAVRRALGLTVGADLSGLADTRLHQRRGRRKAGDDRGRACCRRGPSPTGLGRHRSRTGVRGPRTRRVLFDAALDGVPVLAPTRDPRSVRPAKVRVTR
jgi:hypothetical protein